MSAETSLPIPRTNLRSHCCGKLFRVTYQHELANTQGKWSQGFRLCALRCLINNAAKELLVLQMALAITAQ